MRPLLLSLSILCSPAVFANEDVATGLSVSAGAATLSKMSETSAGAVAGPVGLVAVSVTKLGLESYANSLPPLERQNFMQNSTSVWSGLSVNSILTAAGAALPVGLIGGVVSGVLMKESLKNTAAPSKKVRYVNEMEYVMVH